MKDHFFTTCQILHLWNNFNSFLARGDDLSSADNLNANRLDPDQDLQNVGPDLDPNRLTLGVSESILKRSVDHNKSMKNYPACIELNMRYSNTIPSQILKQHLL